jgi:phosphoribosyl 1,2-cyclic phosphodiesterase
MHDLSVAVLCSGSSGNSILVQSDGSAILVDAGLSCREMERRLSLFGVEPTQIEAVVLTHEHTDHTRGAKRFCVEHEVRVLGTRGTLALTDLTGAESTLITPGKAFEIGRLNVKPFPVRHLAAEPIAISITTAKRKVGIASDLGTVTRTVIEEMGGSDLMLVEANYDESMLLSGNYPGFLKRAIHGDHGHLSNDDAGTLSVKAVSENTKDIVLVHLSRDNNTPDKALETVRSRMAHSKHRQNVSVIEHGSSGGPFVLA